MKNEECTVSATTNRIPHFWPSPLHSSFFILYSSLLLLVLSAPRVEAQEPTVRYGTKISPDVNIIYERGLRFLASTQQDDGGWPSGQQGGAITGLSLMAFLAHGDDPNFGPYSLNVRKALRNLIRSQDASTGYIPRSMYHHGFAMLALAEAYGAVDDTLVWESDTASPSRRSIGEALEMAVRCAVTAQRKNGQGAWRYSPTSSDADTSVSGAVLVGLLAARNAGIEVPDDCIDKALAYYRSSTSGNGMVAYTVGAAGDSMNRSAIATLVFAVGKRKDWQEYEATRNHIVTRLDHQEVSRPFYFRYYMAQALFQGDFEAWSDWKRENTQFLRELQLDDGSFNSPYGAAYGTAMSLLSLALDFRFLPIYER